VEWYTLSITVGTWPSQPLWSGQWGRFFHNCTINGLLFKCMDELPRDEAFVFVHLPLRGANRRFLSSARSVHDPHMNWERGLFMTFHSLLSCCCIIMAVENRTMKTRGSPNYTARIYTCEIWGPNSRVVEDSGLQRCDTLSLRQWFSTFRRNVVLLSLRINESTKNSKQPPSQREVRWCEVKRNDRWWNVLSLIYGYVAVCTFCAVPRYLITLCFYLLFANCSAHAL